MYPAFRSIDVAGLRRAGADPPQPVRFALDVHLGKLSSLRRFVGFDAVTLVDDAAVANAARDGRVVLTRAVACSSAALFDTAVGSATPIPNFRIAVVP